MTVVPPVGVVVDAMVISWLFDDRPSRLADGYRALIGATPVLIAFQIVMELRSGAMRLGGANLGTVASIVGSPSWSSFSPMMR